MRRASYDAAPVCRTPEACGARTMRGPMGPPPPSAPKVAFVTDIVTPYMVAVLEALAVRVDLVTLFCAQTGTRGAEWEFAEPFPFRHRVLNGLTLRRRTPDAADLYP